MNKGKLHIGIKLILSLAMNRLEYNEYRGWELPEDEDGSDKGFLVEYLDGGKVESQVNSNKLAYRESNVFVANFAKVQNQNFERMQLAF